MSDSAHTNRAEGFVIFICSPHVLVSGGSNMDSSLAPTNIAPFLGRWRVHGLHGAVTSALEQEVGEPLSDAQVEEAKNLVVAMGAAEKARGPGGGLKAPGIEPPPRSAC